MLASLHCGDADDAMKMVRRHDFDCIHILFFIQQLAKICIRRAALEGAAGPVGGIVGLDNVLGDVPASRNDAFAAGLQSCFPSVLRMLLRRESLDQSRYPTASFEGSQTETI